MKKTAYIQQKRRLTAQILANGGVYIEDCQPWAIKENCQRDDCPMRDMATVEAQEDDYFCNCDPTGIMADILPILILTQNKESEK